MQTIVRYFLYFTGNKKDWNNNWLYLTILGYNTDEVVGVFGALSENAVRTYQSAKGLIADGILVNIYYFYF